MIARGSLGCTTCRLERLAPTWAEFRMRSCFARQHVLHPEVDGGRSYSELGMCGHWPASPWMSIGPQVDEYEEGWGTSSFVIAKISTTCNIHERESSFIATTVRCYLGDSPFFTHIDLPAIYKWKIACATWMLGSLWNSCK